MNLQELARALEAYVLLNRIGDAVDLAAVIDSFVRERIAEALEADGGEKL